MRRSVERLKLRKLELKDADKMHEWMHDESVVEFMQADFRNKSIDDCKKFIDNASNDKYNCHMAIVNDADEYMGTVSLKNIHDSVAEFAITIRKCAMGQGYSRYGMKEIINYGFNVLNLKSIYWCVSPENKRAVKFYDKNGYTRHDIDSRNFGGGYTRTDTEIYLVSDFKRGNLRKLNMKINIPLWNFVYKLA